MIVAGLLGVVLTLSVLRGADDRREILVAAKDLVPGAVIDAQSVRVERIDASRSVLASTYAPDDLDALEGRVATAAIEKGTLVTRGAVRPREAGAASRSMSFPLAKARAMGGALDTGDRVDVLTVQHDGSQAGYVMTDVEVLDIDGASGGPLGAPDELTVTLAVDADAAVRLAAALEGGTVTLVRSTGAAPDASAAQLASPAPDGQAAPSGKGGGGG
jgi:Flp pilus assembly protein CpaB